MLLQMAWRNLWRHTRRSALTATVMAFSVAFCMVMLAWTDGIYLQMGEAAVTRNLGHVQVEHPDYAGKRSMYDTVHDAEAILVELEGLELVKAVAPRVIGNALLGGPSKTTGAMLLGIEPSREAGVTELDERVVDGTYLADDQHDGLLIGEDLAKKLEVELGDEVVAVTQAADGSLGNALYTVVGTMRTGNPAMDKGGVWLTVTALQDLLALPDQVHEVIVIGDDHHQQAVLPLLEAVRETIPDGLSALPWWEVDPGLSDLMNMQEAASWITIVFVFGVTVLAVVNTLLMSVFERTKELGVMRALGVRPLELVASVVLESVLMGVLAVGIGVVLGLLGDWYMVVVGVDTATQNGEGFEMANVAFDPILRARLTTGSVIKPVVAVFFFSVLAAIWPAARAARLRPVEALRAD